MATARPNILGVLGESADLLLTAQAGVVFPTEDATALAETVSALASTPERAAEMGRRGRRYVEAEMDRNKLAVVMLEELRTVVARE